jgi:hypothetical protein
MLWCLGAFENRGLLFDYVLKYLSVIFQVGHLEEQYQDWVHQPIVSKVGPRFFANDVLEVNILFLCALYLFETLDIMF